MSILRNVLIVVMVAEMEDSQKLTVISGEQASAMGQAETGVTQIAEVVQANSATAEESSATSEELSAQAESMRELVSRFTLNEW